MILVDVLWLLGDAVQRRSGRNILSNDSVKARFDDFWMLFVHGLWLFLDAVQRHSVLNIRFDDSVGAQFDISNDFSYDSSAASFRFKHHAGDPVGAKFDIFSWFWLMVVDYLVMQCSVIQV